VYFYLSNICSKKMAASRKTCSISDCPCDNPQPRSEFSKHKGRTDGLQRRCKTCVKAYDKKRRADPENRRRELQQKKEYEQTEAAKKKRRISQKANVWKKLKNKLAARLRHFVIDGIDSPQNQDTMGCTRAEMRAHLEAQFKDWMSWDNYGLWEFDHIVPYAAFPTVEELEDYTKVVCWYKNVRPLHKTQNSIDGGDYEEEDKQALITKYIVHQHLTSVIDSVVECAGAASFETAPAAASGVMDLFA
jgi:hypothetical protein